MDDTKTGQDAWSPGQGEWVMSDKAKAEEAEEKEAQKTQATEKKDQEEIGNLFTRLFAALGEAAKDGDTGNSFVYLPGSEGCEHKHHLAIAINLGREMKTKTVAKLSDGSTTEMEIALNVGILRTLHHIFGPTL